MSELANGTLEPSIAAEGWRRQGQQENNNQENNSKKASRTKGDVSDMTDIKKAAEAAFRGVLPT